MQIKSEVAGLKKTNCTELLRAYHTITLYPIYKSIIEETSKLLKNNDQKKKEENITQYIIGI